MALPDDALWSEVVRIAGNYGFSLPSTTPPREKMNELRGAVSGGKISMGDAMRFISEYKRGAKNG